MNPNMKIYEPQIYFACAVFRGSKHTNQNATVLSQRIKLIKLAIKLASLVSDMIPYGWAMVH